MQPFLLRSLVAQHVVASVFGVAVSVGQLEHFGVGGFGATNELVGQLEHFGVGGFGAINFGVGGFGAINYDVGRLDDVGGFGAINFEARVELDTRVARQLVRIQLDICRHESFRARRELDTRVARQLDRVRIQLEST